MEIESSFLVFAPARRVRAMNSQESNKNFGAGDRDRTDIISLEGWGSTIELHPQNQDGGGGGIRTSEG